MRLSYSLADQFYRFMESFYARKSDQYKIKGMLHGLPANNSLAMLIGKKVHRLFELETLQTGLPPSLLGLDVGQGTAETRIEQRMYDWCVFSGVKDWTSKDRKLVIDYKVGGKDAEYYLQSHQKGCYKLLDDRMEQFMVVRVNPFTEEAPSDLFDRYFRQANKPCKYLQSYVESGWTISSSKGYSPNYFLYNDKIRMLFGDKVQWSELDKDIDIFVQWLYENIKPSFIDSKSHILTTQEAEETREWVETIASEIRDWCERSGVAWWRLFNRDTGEKIVYT